MTAIKQIEMILSGWNKGGELFPEYKITSRMCCFSSHIGWSEPMPPLKALYWLRGYIEGFNRGKTWNS